MQLLKSTLIIVLLMVYNNAIANTRVVDFYSLTLEELLQVKVTSSTLTSESLLDVPSAMTIFTASEIQKYGFNYLDELMVMVPGYQSYRSSVSSLVNMNSSRGRRIGAASSEILVLIDGHHMNDAITGSAFFGPAKIPLFNIEQVEFIRGPGAAIYGSNAMMGVINIITKKERNQFSLSVSSFDGYQTRFSLAHQYEQFKFDLSGYIDVDQGDNFELRDTYSVGVISTSDPREIASLDMKVEHSNTRVIFRHGQTKVEDFYSIGGTSNGFNQRKTSSSSISIKQNFNLYGLNSWGWLSYNDWDVITRLPLTANGALIDISSPTSELPLREEHPVKGHSEIRVQWHNNKEFDQLTSLQFGFEFRQLDVPATLSKNNYDLEALVNGDYPIDSSQELSILTEVQSSSKRDVVGAYVQYLSELNKSTQLTIGARYDHYSKIGSQFSPRFGLVYRLTQYQNLKLLYGKAFRAPSEFELNLKNNLRLLGNSELEPETVKTWDLIWMGQWQDTGFSIGYFESRFEDPIIASPVGPGVLLYSNAQHAPVKGIELEFSKEIVNDWLIRAVYTYYPKVPSQSFTESDSFGSISLNYQQENWNTNIVASHFSERDMLAPALGPPTRITLASYWLLHSKLNYRITSQLDSFLQINNLLDENYFTPDIVVNVGEGIINRGREIRLGLNYRF
ncbi:MAG: TonB-dependent receptor [Kangiellaceae bacterium]|nr:TonB-dependent receptor [Kangiellaceae bacterium]